MTSLPLPQWLLVNVITGLAAGFTAADSPLRLAAIAADIALSWSVQQAATSPYGDARITGPMAAMGWVNVLNAIDLLLLSRVSYDKQLEWTRKTRSESESESEPPKETKPSLFDTVWERIVWGVGICMNLRRIGTPWQIADLPAFNSKDSAYVPSRWEVIKRYGLEALAATSMLHLFTLEPTYPGIADTLSFVPSSRGLPHPSAATSIYSLLIQTSFMLSFGILIRASIIAPYNFAAIVCIALGISEPSSWPPVSGALSEGWSVRRFWRTTWHQTLRTPLVSNADFLLFSILRLPRGSTIASKLRMVFVFGTSGIVHALMDLGFSVPFSKSGALLFFALQLPAIQMEMFVKKLLPAGTGNKTLDRLIGYAWTLMFLGWASSIWLFPIVCQLFEAGIRLPSPFLFVGGHSFLA